MSETPRKPEDLIDGGGGDGAQKAGDMGARVSRRIFSKVVALLGLGILSDQISGGKLRGLVMPDDEHNRADAKEISERVDDEAKKIAERVEKENPGASDIEKIRKTIDYIGSFVFAWGLYDLSPWGRGHIASAQYGAVLVLSKLKHMVETKEGKHHLEAETVSSLKAFFIINGTIAFAEGLKLDLEGAYEHMKGKAPDKKDQIALMTSLAAVLSPVSTTVGSASIIRKMSNDFATVKDDEGKPKIEIDPETQTPKEVIDHDMAAVFVSHVSNLSGFLLFGDPPFIAVCEKYGFKEGVLWQLKTMWPLAIYSLYSATFKLNYMTLARGGADKKTALKEAAANTASGLTRNIPVLSRMIAHSLVNAAKYFTGADQKWAQNEDGIILTIGEVLTKKIANLGKLPFDPALDLEAHDHEGMVHGEDPEIAGANSLMSGIIDRLFDGEEEGEESLPMKAISDAIEAKDYDRIIEIGAKAGIPNIEVLVETLKDYHDNKKTDYSTAHKPDPESILRKLNPFTIYDRTFSVNRIKAAIGHNMTDVTNVFPFQAGCVPFLTTAFKDGLGALDQFGLSAAQKEASLFMAIAVFSSMADNYVACKIGLELMPEKPHTVLIASILGGSLSAIGNMANVAQFNLEQYPLLKSASKAYWHLDNVAVAACWAAAINMLNGMGIFLPPKVKKNAGSSHASAGETLSDVRSMVFGIGV